MAPAIIDAGPASGRRVTLETRKVSEKNSEPAIDPGHEEYQYLNLIRDILDHGEHRPDRQANSRGTVFDLYCFY